MFAYVFNIIIESKASDYLCRLKRRELNLKQYAKEFPFNLRISKIQFQIVKFEALKNKQQIIRILKSEIIKNKSKYK